MSTAPATVRNGSQVLMRTQEKGSRRREGPAWASSIKKKRRAMVGNIKQTTAGLAAD